MLIVTLLNLLLIALSVIVHYEILRFVSGLMEHMHALPRRRLLVVIGGAFVAHIVEICLYALVFILMQYQWNMGAIAGAGAGAGTWDDFFYFSASSYTTLGMGDIVPTGAMRSVVAMESLVGLVMIGWSTSFTYISMRKFWGVDAK